MSTTYLFYDIETSGLNKCFDQVLQFAAIRTDTELRELARYNFFVKLNPDTVPSAAAVLTHKISLAKLEKEGINEYQATTLIHQLLNTPDTISIGYNTLGFDDEFLRFTFYRNLLPPYTHQYANGCYRMDLYPIATMYYLYHNTIINWPKINDIPTLRLEHLSTANQLTADNANAHDAMVDVTATLALARNFYKKCDIWQYLQGFFNKTEDAKRYEKLNIALDIDGYIYPDAILVDGSLGAKNNYQTVVLALGWHRYYKNQFLWLDLGKKNLTDTTINDIATIPIIYRKKLGEPPLLLPTLPRLLTHLSQERYVLINHNLAWLKNNPHILQAISKYHQEYTYPPVINIDVDAALYQNGFLSDAEQELCRKFHAANVQEKINLLTQFTNPKLRTQALRLLGRNYITELPTQLHDEFNQWLIKIYSTDNTTADTTRDYRNEPRLSINQALQQLQQLQATIDSNTNPEKHLLLVELENRIGSLRAQLASP